MSSLSEPFIGTSPPLPTCVGTRKWKNFVLFFWSCQLKSKNKAFAALFSEQTTKTSFGWRLFFTMSAVLFYSIFILAIFAFSLLGNHFHHAKETRSDFFLRAPPLYPAMETAFEHARERFFGAWAERWKVGLTHSPGFRKKRSWEKKNIRIAPSACLYYYFCFQLRHGLIQYFFSIAGKTPARGILSRQSFCRKWKQDK